MSSSNCCFLTCIQVSQEAGQVVWYSYLLNNFPQFLVIHTVKDFGVVNKADIDVFLELSCFFSNPTDVGNWSLVPLPFLNLAWTCGSYYSCTVEAWLGEFWASLASLVAQTVKRLPAMRETWVQSLDRENPLEKEMATHSSTLAWKIPWSEEPCRLQSMGS